MNKFICFIVVFAVIMSFFTFSVFASADYTTNDGYATYPIVTNSSIDYGFINYSVPYVENLNGTILGGSALFSPYFNDFSPFIEFEPDTSHYYSYSASAVLNRDAETSFIKNTMYLGVMSLNFDKPVYRATFKIFLDSRCSFGSSYVFSSFGGDNLAQWNRTTQSNYLYISIYNIKHPVRFFFQFKPTSSNLDEVGFNISLAELTYSDETAEQIANDNANTDKITNNNNANTDKITSNNNANTDKITDNQNQNTQDIIDNQNQLQENEKTDANTTGNGGVDSLVSSIPTDSAGVVSAFKSLTDSMTTTDLTCKLNFPGISIPAIGNFFGDVELLAPCDINLRDYISMIPYKLLLLVQSLSTIALIVFCFKELYSIVSYVLTLRGGGSE